MPVTELKEERQNWVETFCVSDPKSGLDVEVVVSLDWPGDAYFSGGRGEAWSLEVLRDPTFAIESAVLCDGEDTFYNLSRSQVLKVLDMATEKYWETYTDD